MEQKSVQTRPDISPEERAMLLGDLRQLSAEQRSSLYMKVCHSLGLNPLTQPFQYLELNGKLVLYAARNCTDQLRAIHNVSLTITARERIGDIFSVSAKASKSDGRVDESIGAVTIGHLKGDALANALMKAETKAKRRVTLSICGLSFLDETELETVRDARPVPADTPAIAPSSAVTGFSEPTPNPTPANAHLDQNETPNSHDDMPSFADEPEPPPMPPAQRPAPKNYAPQTAGDWQTYTVRFGKFTGKTMEQIGINQAQKYVEWMEKTARESGKPMSDAAREFADMFRAYFVHRQMAPAPTGYNKQPPPPGIDEHEEIPF